MNMAKKTAPPLPPNPHQDAINNLVNRVLPRVRAMPFAKNNREPWLGNATVDKAVLATIEIIFAIADEDAAAKTAEPTVIEASGETAVVETTAATPVVELPEMDQS
jgi:hypothetical protein